MCIGVHFKPLQLGGLAGLAPQRETFHPAPLEIILICTNVFARNLYSIPWMQEGEHTVVVLCNIVVIICSKCALGTIRNDFAWSCF
jgi:hypothetical protein